MICEDFPDDARMPPRVMVNDDGHTLSRKPTQGAGDSQACTNASELAPRFEGPGRFYCSEGHEGCSRALADHEPVARRIKDSAADVLAPSKDEGDVLAARLHDPVRHAYGSAFSVGEFADEFIVFFTAARFKFSFERVQEEFKVHSFQSRILGALSPSLWAQKCAPR